jgi:hypothetical protein
MHLPNLTVCADQRALAQRSRRCCTFAAIRVLRMLSQVPDIALTADVRRKGAPLLR